MKNHVTFVKGYARPDRDRIARVLGLLPADIVCSEGELPALCVGERRRPLPRSYNVIVAGSNGWSFDYQPYIGQHAPELVSHTFLEQDKYMFATFNFGRNLIHYSFQLHTPGISQ